MVTHISDTHVKGIGVRFDTTLQYRSQKNVEIIVM